MGRESRVLGRNIFSHECHFLFNFVFSFKDPDASVERKALQEMTFGKGPIWDTTQGCKRWDSWQLFGEQLLSNKLLGRKPLESAED